MARYDPTSGEKVDETAELILDMRKASRVRLVNGPYGGVMGTVTKKTAEGNYRVLFDLPPYGTILGVWNIEAALNGQARYVPVVNVP